MSTHPGLNDCGNKNDGPLLVGDRFGPSPAASLPDKLITNCAADIEPECIEWLWPGRVPVGKLTLITGEPGLGKSQVAIAMAVQEARPGDIVLIAGKGHEKVQVLKSGAVPFDDVAVAADTLKELE